MSAKTEKTPETYLSKVWPAGTVKFEGVTIKVTPLSIEQLFLVGSQFEKLVRLKSEGKTDKEIIFLALEEIKEILQLVVDKQLSEIPGAMFPMVARVFLKQHLTSELLGEWLGLVADAAQLFSGGLPEAIQAKVS